MPHYFQTSFLCCQIPYSFQQNVANEDPLSFFEYALLIKAEFVLGWVLLHLVYIGLSCPSFSMLISNCKHRMITLAQVNWPDVGCMWEINVKRQHSIFMHFLPWFVGAVIISRITVYTLWNNSIFIFRNNKIDLWLLTCISSIKYKMHCCCRCCKFGLFGLLTFGLSTLFCMSLL